VAVFFSLSVEWQKRKEPKENAISLHLMLPESLADFLFVYCLYEFLFNFALFFDSPGLNTFV